MSHKKKRPRALVELPVVQVPDETPKARRNFARWRAFSLSLVYLVFAAHIIHWKITGKTLAPLELNEVMYTLERGIITAGFIFMCALVLGTLIFGRFFCSWACHIIVLQDLCAWILRKLGIRQKPIRSRLLLLVPALTAFYMFIWPQILRTWESRALPAFHLASDADGWASFVTNNFWRNLPSAPIIILTFLVCGFFIIYLLGSRTFCTYVCPYGAVFSLADRFSPGRLVVDHDACEQCGTCTAACTSGIRVHEEVKQHGMIVNPACLKDLDCVSACPQGALSYKFSMPSFFKSRKSGGRFGSLPYDFSIAEELLIACVFIVVLLSFRGLYSRIPFLLSLALGGIFGCFAVAGVRLFKRPNVTLASWQIKRLGRLTRGGRVFAGIGIALTALVVHSGFVRYHEYHGLRQVRALRTMADAPDVDALAESALGHLSLADRWGLIRNIRVERGVVKMASHLARFDEVETFALRYLVNYPGDIQINLQLGQALLRQERKAEAEGLFRALVSYWDGQAGDPPAALAGAHLALGGLLAERGNYAAAEGAFRMTIRLDPDRAEVHAELGGVLAELGRTDDAVASLEESIRLDPEISGAYYNLGTILGHLGRFDEAIPWYEQALTLDPDDAELHNNLGFACSRTGRNERAKEHFEQALAINPNSADAHFNLATLLADRSESEEADRHFRLAARLDPRYARILGNTTGS